ncbi:hypothetical protein [Microbacterium sp. SORGH_AS_0505]|uniref:hypothetical protein n=1 Tax=Microbacterium sp. SORGH_AS_0505 TaxID=3041770 RepID=UPI0027D7881A|nr:hypothetical protein [Microbacterium sp. SORGH_AS_0505]
MDSGWAAILGAVIGLIGSTLAGVIAPTITRRREAASAEAAALRSRRAAVIRELVASYAESYEDEGGSSGLLARRETALTDLALIISSEETPVLEAAESAGSLVSGVTSDLSATAFVEISRLLPSWHRGEITPLQLQARFERVVEAARPAED